MEAQNQLPLFERRTIDLPEIDPAHLANRDKIRAFKEIGITPGKVVYWIPVGLIVVRKNGRTDFGDLELLADGILESGGAADPIMVDIMDDGTTILTDGERRYRAYIIINNRGITGFEKIPALVNNKDLTELQRMLLQYNANNVKRFTDMEDGAFFRELQQEHGLSVTEIAKKTGNNKMHVSNMLRLQGITPEERQLISEGAVKPTAVLDMVKGGIEPQARVQAIKTAQEQGTRVKVRDVANMRQQGDLLPGTIPPPLPRGTKPDVIIKDLKMSLKTLETMAGSDSKMLDLTFKMYQRLKQLESLMC